MKKYQLSDINTKSFINSDNERETCQKLDIRSSDLLPNPNYEQPIHFRYGLKLATPHMIHFNNREQKVYACCVSNVSVMYIKVGKRRITIDVD